MAEPSGLFRVQRPAGAAPGDVGRTHLSETSNDPEAKHIVDLYLPVKPL